LKKTPNRLLTDAFREIRNTRSRFLSLFLLSALAVAFLAGLRTTAPDMEYTADDYYDRTHLMDVRVLSTLGLTDEDISALAAAPGVKTAEGAWYIDATVHAQQNDYIVRFHSLSEAGVNDPELLEGRLPQAPDECVVEPALLASVGLSIGDPLVLDMADTSYADSLHYETYTIVGTVNTSLYLSLDRGTSTIGTGRLSAVAFLPRAAFDLDYYTEAYLLADGTAELMCYGDAYQEKIDALIDSMKPLGDQRSALRYDEVITEAADALADAEREYADAEAEARQKLADAQAELDDARRQLDDGWEEYYDGQATLRRETADAQQQIADAERQLPDALAELEQGEADYADGAATLADGRAEYEQGLADYQDALELYNDGCQKLLDGEAEYADSRQKLIDGQAEYEQGLADYQAGKAELDDAKAQLDDAYNQLLAGSAQLSQGQAQLEEGRQQLAMAQQAYDAALQAYNAAVKQLEDAGLDNPEDLADRLEHMTDEELDAAWAAVEATRDQLQQQLEGLDEGDPLYGPLRDALDQLPQTRDEMRQQIIDNSGDIASGLLQAVDTAKAALDDAEAQLGAAQKEVEAGQAQLNAGAAALAAGQAQYNAGKREYDEGLAALEDAEAQLSDAKAELDDGWRQLDEGRAELDDGWAELDDAKVQLDDARVQLDDAAREIADGEAELADARQKLDDGWAEYNDGLAELDDARERLPREVADAEQKLADAYQELTDGEAEYADGLREYEDGKQEAEEKLSDARRQLNDARRAIADIQNCKWYILGRNTNTGYVSFQQDSERMGNLANVFPLIFFLVAALVCLTTMTRMVEEQRVQIGGMKALGYSRGAIALKYVGYGFLASFGGGLVGLVVGCTLIPTIIFNAWKVMYTVGDLEITFFPGISLLAVGAAVFCVTGTALASSFAALTAVPASLMRPRAPQAGKRVFLEHLPFIWRRLTFTWKVTVRNLFRYKKRFWMTVIGIGGCTALLITGFGLRDSIHDIFDVQYDELTTYHAQVSLADDVTDDELLEIGRELDRQPLVDSWTTVSSSMVTAEGPRRSMDSYVYLFAVTDGSKFGDFVHLRSRQTGETVPLTDDGAVITEKLASMLGVGVGDSITIVDADNTRTAVPISGITENYIMHYIYLSHGAYTAIYGQEPPVNSVMLRYTEDTVENSDAVSSRLIPLAGVSSVTRTMTLRESIARGLEGVDYAVIVVVISAAALAFVVLYNLTNINITERLRELATLKVLGFYEGELSAYVYRENIFLTIFGVLLGLVMGKFLHQWLVLTVEIDMAMFGRTAKPMSYLLAVVLTILFSVLVNLVARLRLRKIDMVESLKTVE